MKDILFTEYMNYRTVQRNYRRERIEEILRYSAERYYDTETGRKVVVGVHEGTLIMIPFEESETSITPITVHATTRQQLRFRLHTRRFANE